MKMHVDYEWSKRQLARHADEEEECAAGIPDGVLARIGAMPPLAATAAPGRASSVTLFPGALGRLIGMLRRRDNLTHEALATRAEVELAELVLIEQDEKYKPRPRTVVQLSKVFGVPSDRLAKLAGLKIDEDPGLAQATLKFAAHSEELTRLTKAERDALNEYLAYLTRQSR